MSGSAERAAAGLVPGALPDATATIRAAVDAALAGQAGREPADGDPPWEYARSVLAAIGQAGGLRACLRPDGPELSLDGLRTLIQHLAVRAPSGVTLVACVQAALFIPIMADLAADAQRCVLDEVLDGQAAGAVAISDAGMAGSDPAAMATTLRQDDDGWILSGSKDWVSAACIASYLVVCARTGTAGRHFSNFSLVLVPAGLPGVFIRPRDTAVMQHAGLGSVEFSDVRLPRGALVGRPGRGLAYFLRYVATERLAGGFWATSVGRDQVRRTAAWLRRRDLAGGSLWDNPAIRRQLAEAAVSIRLIEALTEDILRQRRTAPPPTGDTAVLKAALAPRLTSALDTCVQLHGAAGLTTQGGLTQLLADARAFGVAGGTTETMLELVAQGELVLGDQGAGDAPEQRRETHGQSVR